MHFMELVRVSYHPQGTFGVLIDKKQESRRYIGGLPFAVTGEEVWRENKTSISCIPAATYNCKRWQSPKFGETFLVQNVPGRSLILFHPGNTHEDTEGCILVAESFHVFNQTAGVAQSQQGFKEFMDRLTGVDAFILTIRDA